MKCAVCAITFRRPESLSRLLQGLAELTFQRDTPDLRIIIVDNDPAASARTVCERARESLRWPLRYEIEPTRGIPFARNTAVRCALESADLIAFIDDDEIPEPEWLDELLEARIRHHADVITGPVLPHFPEPVPDWIVRGQFFESRRHPDGATLDVAYTHNVLVTAETYRAFDTPFDPRFALTGGTDTLFFRRVVDRGFCIRWADRAVVTEWIPPTRACAGWLIRRAYRAGLMLAIAQRNIQPRWATPLIHAVKGVAWIGIGTLATTRTIIRGRRALVHGLQLVAFGFGYWASLAGLRYEEYKTTHST